MASLIEVIQVLNVLYIAYPRHASRLTDLQVEQTNSLYARLLADLDESLLKAAAEQHIAENEFFPQIAELRNCAHRLMCTARHIVSAEEAWGTVMRAAGALGRDTNIAQLKVYFGQRHGAESSVLMAQAVQSVGWRDICNCDEEHIGVVRAHFYRTYETFEKRDSARMKLLPHVQTVVDDLAAQFTRHALPQPLKSRPLPSRRVQSGQPALQPQQLAQPLPQPLPQRQVQPYLAQEQPAPEHPALHAPPSVSSRVSELLQHQAVQS